MSFISFFKKSKEADDKAREEKARAIHNIEKTIAETKAAMQKAAEEGNGKEYARLKTALETYENDRIVRVAARIKEEHNPAKLLEEWNKYAEQYNKNFTKAYEEYKSAKADLLNKFRNLADMQREAAAEATCANMVNIEKIPAGAVPVLRIDPKEADGIDFLGVDIREKDGIRIIIKNFQPLESLDAMHPGWWTERTPEQIRELEERKKQDAINDMKAKNKRLKDWLRSFDLTLEKAVKGGLITEERAAAYNKYGI